MFQITEALKKVPFFQDLDRDAINDVIDRLQYKRIPADEIICKAGDTGDKMYIIVTGQVKVFVQLPNGDESVIAYLESGAHFGEMTLLTGEPRSASVITTGPMEMFVLAKTDFDHVIERFPSITLSMGKVMSHRLSNVLKKTARDNARVTAVTGDLSEKSLADILRFCEINALSGEMKLQRNGQNGVFYYERGELQRVAMGELHEDAALDAMLAWEDGNFVIEPRPIRLEDTDSSVAETQGEAADTPEQNVEQPKLDRQLVLVVSNSAVVRKLLSRALAAIDLSSSPAATVEKALYLNRLQRPGLIISGTKLPDGSGADLLKSIRNTSRVPFLFLTEGRSLDTMTEETRGIRNVYFTPSQGIPDVINMINNIRSSKN